MFKVFYADEYGEVVMDKDIFTQLLEEVYQEGYKDGQNNPQRYWVTPNSNPNVTEDFTKITCDYKCGGK